MIRGVDKAHEPLGSPSYAPALWRLCQDMPHRLYPMGKGLTLCIRCRQTFGLLTLQPVTVEPRR